MKNGETHDPQYWDKDYLLFPWGENQILFTAYAVELGYPLTMRDVSIAAASQMSWNISEVKFEAVEGEKWSHDNHTGLMCLIRGRSQLPEFLWWHWWERPHPRDLIFQALMDDRLWVRLIGWLFFPVFFGIMVRSILHSKETLWNGERAIPTSGKLLAWLMCRTLKLNRTLSILSRILFAKFEWTWYDVFDYYFKDENHPCVLLSKEIYEGN